MRKFTSILLSLTLLQGLPAAATASGDPGVDTTHAYRIDSGEDPGSGNGTENIICFQNGDNTVTVDEPLLFYDNMGPEGKYTTEAKGSMTFVPAQGKCIRMTIRDFNTFYSEKLYFYDGNDTSAPLLLERGGTLTSDLPLTLIAKNDGGAITVAFNPTRDGKNRGWEILVEAFVPQPLAVTKVTATPVNDTKLMRGSRDNRMVRIQMDIEGDKGTVNVDRLTFASLDTDNDVVTSAKVWHTGESADFGTSDLFGEALIADEMAVTGSHSYDTKGTYYYWLSYDVDPSAESGSKVQAQLTSVSVGDNTYTAAEQTPALTTVQDGIHGTITVGTSGDYDFNTIQSAIDSLEAGIDGPVTISVADGNYKELVTVPAVTGSSDINTITVCSASGNADKAVITYDRYSDPGSSHYDKRYGVFTLDGVAYFTLKDVTVTTGTYTGFPGVVFVRNASRHCTVDNCIISSPVSTDYAKGTNLVNMYSKNEADCNSDYFTLRNSTLEGGLIGISLQGTGYVALPKQKGGSVIGNRFVNQGSKAVYISSENGATVQGNTISCGSETTTSYYAFDLNEFDGNLDVSGNSIYMDGTKGAATGMYVRMYNPAQREEGFRRIYNNEINLVNTESAVTGIRVNNEIPGLEIVANTVSITPAPEMSNSACGIYFNGGMKGGQVTDNIVQNLTEGTALSVNRADYLENISFRTNAIYSKDSSKLVYVGGSGNMTGNKDFESWMALGFDSGSFCEQTEFLSEKILEPAREGSLLGGTPVAFVTTDLYGADRDSEHPTIGAYEYAAVEGAPAMAEGYPQSRELAHHEASVAVKATLTGKMNYMVVPATETAPDRDALMASPLAAELRKGVEATLKLTGLEPKRDYVFYALLTSMRGETADKVDKLNFTTTFRPTEQATFEEAKTTGSRIEDGTFSFTGFELTDITDGVAPEPNVKAAAMTDEYAVVELTNADNLVVDGFYVKNSAEATLTAKNDRLADTGSKTIPAHEAWTYVNLRDMGGMTYLEIETEGDLMIDNFAGMPHPLSVTIDRDEAARTAEDTELTLPSVAEGGVQPYSYAWTDAAGNSAGTDAVAKITPKHSATYSLEVTDAWGAKASARTDVLVDGKLYAATFDDLYLAPESYWRGYTEDPDYTAGNFYSGSMGFNNTYTADWDSWTFFSYSNKTSTDFSTYALDQWNSAVGQGADGSANYGVVFVSNWQGNTEMTLTNSTADQKLDGMWITNSAWVADAIVNGDGMEGAFGKDDWMKLRLTGVKADGTLTSPAEYYLADYRAEEERDRWYLDTWQWIDLSPLGEICKVRFDLESTKSNAYGMTTPSYVCVDNIGTPKPVTVTPTQILKVNDEEPTATVDTAGFFSFDPEEATVSYTVDDPTGYVSESKGILTVTAPVNAEFTVGIDACQRGRHEFVEMPVRMDLKPAGILSAELDNVAVYPNPATDHFIVSAPSEGFNVELFSADGLRIKHHDNAAGKLRVDVSGLPAGTYIVKVTDYCSGACAARKLLILR